MPKQLIRLETGIILKNKIKPFSRHFGVQKKSFDVIQCRSFEKYFINRFLAGCILMVIYLILTE